MTTQWQSLTPYQISNWLLSPVIQVLTKKLCMVMIMHVPMHAHAHTHMHACAGQVHAHTHSYIYSLSKLQLLNIMTNAAKSPKHWFQALLQWQPEKIYWNLLYLPQHISSNFPNLSHDKMGELSTYIAKFNIFCTVFSLKLKCAKQSHFTLG